MNTQGKFTDMLEARVVEAGFDFVNDRQYGNTGHFIITLKGTFTQLADVYYSFQQGYVTFQGDYKARVQYGDLGNALDAIIELTEE